jgi:putative transposase
VQPKAKADLHAIYEAASRADAEAAFDRFLAKYEAKYDKANPVESTFATVRLRTVKTNGCLSRATASPWCSSSPDQPSATGAD